MPRGIPNSGPRRQSRRATGAQANQQQTWGARQTKQLQKIHELIGGLYQQFGGATQGATRGRGRMTGTRRKATTSTRRKQLAATG